MTGILGSIFRRGGRRAQGGGLELVVVEGADRGARFSLDQPEIRIGRGSPDRRTPDQILLRDRSVSSQHAVVTNDAGRVVIRHLPTATNPTLVNGRPVKRQRPLAPGDQIALGLAVLELRAVPATAAEAAPEPDVAVGATTGEPSSAAEVAAGHLVLTDGVPELEGQRFAFSRGRTTIGRSEKCDITVANSAVSRRHAALVWEGERLALVHESMVNPTHVNGVPVTDRQPLSYGDEIRLAERVTFTVLISAAAEVADSGATRLTAPEPEAEDPTVIRSASTEVSSDRTVIRPATSAPLPAPTVVAEPPAGVGPDSSAAPEPAPAATPEPPPIVRQPAPAAEPPPPEPEPAAPSPPAPTVVFELGGDGRDSLHAPAPRRVRTPTPLPASYDGPLDLVIVGSGPAGLAAACQAAAAGIGHTLLERDELASTVHGYHKGKWVMDEPQRLGLQPNLDVGFEAGTREDVLAAWRAAVERVGVNLRQGAGCELVKLDGEQGDFTLTLKDGSTLPATHVVLAIGVQGNRRSFDVPGADRDWIRYQLADPAEHAGKSVVVVGVGDAGIENALALVEQDCQVSIVNRREEFDRAKPRNRALIERAISAGQVAHYTNASVEQFEDQVVVLHTNEGQVRLQADLVIGRLGATAPRSFLEEIGIEFPSEDPGAVPEVTERYETNLAGVYLIGALAGYPLIKNCMNQGYEVVEHILGHRVIPADEPVLEEKLSGIPGTVREILDRIRDVIPIFSGLTTIQLREFLFDSEVRRLPAGSQVFARNDFSDSFFAILEGKVRATVPATESDAAADAGEGDRVQREAILPAGSFFGEGGLISGRRRSATIEVAEEAILIETPRMTMTRLIRSVDDVRRVIDEAFVVARLRDLIPEVPPEARAELAAGARLLSFKPGETVFEEGSEPDGLHIIRRGTVTISQRRDGLDSVIQYFQAGSILGEVALLEEGRRRSTSVRATVFTETVLLPRDVVVPFMHAHGALRRLFEKGEREYAMADAARGAEQRARGTMMFVLKEGGHEATDLLLIDESLCVRCDNCEKACAATHGGVSRLDRQAGATYATSQGSQLHIPTACQHCENPKCMDDCPPDALRRDPDGEVFIMDNCIGCGNCVVNCPYGVIQMAAVDDDPGPGLLLRLLFGARAQKQVPLAAEGAGPEKKLAVKCDLCRALPPMRDGSARAACVASCPTGAIVRVNPRDYLDEILDARR